MKKKATKKKRTANKLHARRKSRKAKQINRRRGK